jgi:menaquinone-dependent protoporphyrinogen oxidase
MKDKILIAYTTAAGSTAEVAQAIGEEISKRDEVVEVVKAKEVKDLSPYRAVIVGTGIRAGHVYRDTLNFLERHQAALSQVPVAYFVVCMTMKDDTEENRCQVDTYVDQMREKAPQVKPADIGLFAGKMDFKTLSFPLKMIIKAMKGEEGDFRNWDAVRDWAAAVQVKLSAT